MSVLQKIPTALGYLKAPFAAVIGFSPFIVAGFVGYAAADLAILNYRPKMLPTEAPPVRPNRNQGRKFKPLNQYAAIWDRNPLNEDGVIPPALSNEQDAPQEQQEQEAVLSKLPLALLGTIVHFNPDRSIATIEQSGKNTGSYKVGDRIERIAEVTEVTRRRVTFRNLNNRRLEYIEIPDDLAFSFDAGKPASTNAGPIQKTGNDFTVDRSEIERLTNNLSEVLQQARMEPRFGPDNQINGFCFVSIKPDTVYQKFGFQVGDCLENVEGEPINSPQKAMEFYNKLRNSSNIRIGINRGGKSEDFNYQIR